MLDTFLKHAYQVQKRTTFVGDIEELLRQLPDEDLSKLAHVGSVKTAFATPECKDDSYHSWITQFQGSPLMDQAIALEQQEIQADMLSMQRREEMRARGREEDQVWDMKDKIRLQRRLLELQLAKEQAGMAGAPMSPPPPQAGPDAPAQGAGAMGAVPAEGVQDNSQGIVGGKTASATAVFFLQHARNSEKWAFADNLGRELARGDAHQIELRKVAVAAGQLLAKEAGGLGAIAGLLGKAAPMAGKAIGFAAKNPALTGAAIGAAGGALAGGEGHRLSGAVGGAALGAGAGSAAGGIAKNMQGGQSLLGAAKSYGGGLVDKAKGLVGGGAPAPGGRATMPSMNPSMTTPSLAPPNPMDFAKRNMFGQPKMAMTERLIRGIPQE